MPRTKRKVKRAKKKSSSDDTVDSHEEGAITVDSHEEGAISTGECEAQGIEEDDLGACGGLAAGTKIKSIKRPKRCMDEDGFFFDLSANMSDMDTADPDNSESDDCHGPVSIYVNENVCQGRYTVDKKEGFAESHQFFLDENKWKTCLDCSTKQPLTLSKLCCLTAILKLNWYEVEGTSLSSWMVKRLVATALTRLDDLDLKEQERVCSSISVLLPHWPNEELNLSSYGPSPSCFKFVVELTLKFFLEDFEGKRNLRLERLVMSDYDSDDLFYYSAGFARDYNAFYKMVLSSAKKFMATWKHSLSARSSKKYVFATNVAIRNDEEFTETLSALRLFRDHRCPFEIRIVRMIFYEIQVEQIAEVFSEINPTYVESVSVRKHIFMPRYIQELDRILADCDALCSLSLFQLGQHPIHDSRYQEELADAMSSLLNRHLTTVAKLQLSGFMILNRAEKYPLPPSLEQLRLISCQMTNDDWKCWARQSKNMEGIELLSVRCCQHDANPLGRGFLKFLKRHSHSLTELEIVREKCSLDVQDLKAIAQNFSESGKLESFLCRVENGANTINVVSDVMHSFLAIRSLEKLTIESSYGKLRKRAVRNSLKESMRALCRLREGPSRVWIKCTFY